MVAFGMLWLLALLLGGLLLVLYRQVDKAYGQRDASHAGGLLPGVDAPGLEVLTANGSEPLQLPETDERVILAFMTTTCPACSTLTPILADDSFTDIPVIALMSGEENKGAVIPDSSRFQTLWLAHPPDAAHRYGATVAPFVYVLRGRTVLASKAASSKGAIAQLLEEASQNEQRLSTQPAGEPEAFVAG